MTPNSGRLIAEVWTPLSSSKRALSLANDAVAKLLVLIAAKSSVQSGWAVLARASAACGARAPGARDPRPPNRRRAPVPEASCCHMCGRQGLLLCTKRGKIPSKMHVPPRRADCGHPTTPRRGGVAALEPTTPAMPSRHPAYRAQRNARARFHSMFLSTI